MRQLFFILLLATVKGEQYQHDNWLKNGYDTHELSVKVTHKRDVKKAANGLFYSDGPYVSHDNFKNQVHIARPQPSPLTLHQNNYTTVTTKRSVSPYTYAVTASSVTPTASYFQSPTPIPNYDFQRSSLPSKVKDYVTVTPSTNSNPYTYAVTASSVTPASPYEGSPTPSSPIEYRSLPTPTYPPSKYQQFHSYTPNPFYHSTPTPVYNQGPLDPILLSNKGPIHHQPIRQAPADSFSVESQINDFFNFQNPPSKFNFIPQGRPALNNIKPALTFDDQQTVPLSVKSQEQSPRNEFIPLFDQPISFPKLSPQQNDQVSFQHNFNLGEDKLNNQNSNLVLPQSSFQTQFNLQNIIPQQGPKATFSSPKSSQPHTAVTPQPIFSPSLSKFNLQEFRPRISEKSPQRQPKLFVPNQQNIQDEQLINFNKDIESNLVINQGEQTLFQSINQQAEERPALWKMAGRSKKQHMNKEDALSKLMKIAGDDWDAEIGIEQNLISDQSNFQCPASEGHFPDPDKCSVYYQCAGGNPRRNECQPGLKYNVLTNQCDWEASVDCSLNKGQAFVKK